MAENEKDLQANEPEAKEEKKVSETWAQDVIEDMDDSIEAQGIYLRQ